MAITPVIPRADRYRPGLNNNALSSRRFANPRGSPPKRSSPLNPNRPRNHTPPPKNHKPKRPSPLNPNRILAAPPPKKLKQFHPFSRLPLTIQNQIYSYLLPAPRTITVKVHTAPDFYDHEEKKHNLHYLINPLPFTPVALKTLLRTSQQSRTFTQQHYQPCLYPTASPPIGIRDFYYSPKRDTLCFTENDFHRFVWARGFNALNEKGVDEEMERLVVKKYFEERYKDGTYRNLTRFAGLKMLGLGGLRVVVEGLRKTLTKEESREVHERILAMEWRRLEKEGRVGVTGCVVEVLDEAEMSRMMG